MPKTTGPLSGTTLIKTKNGNISLSQMYARFLTLGKLPDVLTRSDAGPDTAAVCSYITQVPDNTTHVVLRTSSGVSVTCTADHLWPVTNHEDVSEEGIFSKTINGRTFISADQLKVGHSLFVSGVLESTETITTVKTGVPTTTEQFFCLTIPIFEACYLGESTELLTASA